MQRKPANRLGLRGATEVKEHGWLKMFPWKDLYEKKLDAPFLPKFGDNFDAKYCNAPDKIGNDTKEKYEGYLRDEGFKDIFRGFTYLNDNINGENTANNNNNMAGNSKIPNINSKFTNPHLNIANYNYGGSGGHIQNNNLNASSVNVFQGSNSGMNSARDSLYNGNGNNMNVSNSMIMNAADRTKGMAVGVDKSLTMNIENKFLKLKKQSNSSSTSSLLRQYKQSNISNNTTSTSINYLNKKSGSTVNFNNQ